MAPNKKTLNQALSILREAAKLGHVDIESVNILSREIFTDSMISHIGNYKAYCDFLTRPKIGFHIRMDGNDFGNINKKYGFEIGNEAIILLGNTIRESMNDSVGIKHGKVFRIGGDEFHAFVPSLKDAIRFIKNIRHNLKKIVFMNNDFLLSLSIGVGINPTQAEFSLINAKNIKKERNCEIGKSETYSFFIDYQL